VEFKLELQKSILCLIKRHKKIVKGIIISICSLLFIYLGITIYFMNHFYFGSLINNINVSGKSVEEVNKQMAAELNTYVLEIKERDGKSEQIRGDEVGLTYSSDGQFKELKDTQNPYEWASSVLNTEDLNMVETVKCDEQLLRKRIDTLACFDSNNIIEPKNPSFEYIDNGYAIVSEIQGNKVNKDILYDHLLEVILKEETALDLESINCYLKPQYISSSPKIIDTQNLLNKYVFSKITYAFGEHKEILDGSIINKWLTVDENFKVTFNELGVKNYIDKLSDNYNTIGKKRNFISSSGKIKNVAGGDYGWSINRAKETQTLITAIRNGQIISKEPAYIQTALSHGGKNDIGNTYVEIDLTNQHLWFYKNGSLKAQGDVVTGNVSAKHSTPGGIYKLKYKQKNAILRGPGYAAPVTYWMPFNEGIGIHDASWRSDFGGKIYKTDGSHGCINSPYYLAKAIFDNIESGIPVVCYN